MKETIFWDFDGVILDSMSIRSWGFKEIFKDYNNVEVQKLIDYHNLNGGLSRYVKIRFFYEEVLKKEIKKEEVVKYANNFSLLMKKELTNPNNLIEDSLNFIKENYINYNFHIVSGSDQEELRYLCKELNIDKYFLSIHGSPTSKNQLVKDILEAQGYDTNKTCLIGDSINDLEAASKNTISFFGYNNEELLELNSKYIYSFDEFLI